MANPAHALRIVLLTDHRLASRASEPALVDSGVIFAQRFIRQRFPAAARRYQYPQGWVWDTFSPFDMQP